MNDLVKIAGNWFPRSLLVDVSIGHLNLAEAVLEEAKGGPISTLNLMKQVELSANADEKLLEFSFDLALQEDDRFDEVGPSGETLWFLKQFEPEGVKEKPIFLQYHSVDYPKRRCCHLLSICLRAIFLMNWRAGTQQTWIKDKVTIALSFPHWRSGTLPLSST